ncbi:MAG: DUF4426 domain-containing protein [Pseudomonadales bacterium]|nr:DUF4426 domain-containing protein [Pseudomonadales bacterium]MBO6566747.1 DUF4426 domain-containing protein [Pseudomonadales bacterium]MBO6596695.1 DUF4426 domain-containing protein [Pseudomonadales bacterium]MBO6655996.1 DUF4426 domain-containing protein [Pseudomonadales bacterium]MBO6703366.1 DUF4426 domain-containing protein [Pseudomonadales bacterium]
MRCLYLLAALAFAPVELVAAQYIDHDGHRIHYTTFSSMIIPPDVAALHNIVRSENRIVLNISGIKDDQPISLVVSGDVVNLLNQQYELEFQEVTESEAVYYLASHLALEQDILRFNLLITLNSGESVPINFLRRYD